MEQIPDAPRFCKRVSKDEMERTSKEMTKSELSKLQHSTTTSSTDENTSAPKRSYSTDKDLHVMLLECMDRLQSLSTHQCELADKFSSKSSECLEHRNKFIELQKKYEEDLVEWRDRNNHLEKLCEEYEDDVKGLEFSIDSKTKIITRLNDSLNDVTMTRDTFLILFFFSIIFHGIIIYLVIYLPEMLITFLQGK